MNYFEGFLVPVPSAERETYRELAEMTWPMFERNGATRMVEAWGDDVPRGEVNDLYQAVEATAEETVVFSWIEYPDKPTRDAAHKAMASDTTMEGMPAMPFDGKRMIWSGFDLLHAGGEGGTPGYIDGVVLPVPEGKKQAYLEFCKAADAAMIAAGAIRVVDGWGEDLMEGKQTDYLRATHREAGETVVFSWVEWPDKPTRDKGWERLMADERLSGPDRPFDGRRMMHGGFVPIVDV